MDAGSVGLLLLHSSAITVRALSVKALPPAPPPGNTGIPPFACRIFGKESLPFPSSLTVPSRGHRSRSAVALAFGLGDGTTRRVREGGIECKNRWDADWRRVIETKMHALLTQCEVRSYGIWVLHCKLRHLVVEEEDIPSTIF